MVHDFTITCHLADDEVRFDLHGQAVLTLDEVRALVGDAVDLELLLSRLAGAKEAACPSTSR